MRKHLLTAGVLIGLLAAPVAASSYPSEARAVQRSVGAPVYDLDGFRVGRIAGYVVQAGAPSAIVDLRSPSKDVAIDLQNLEPRAGGGWLATLDSASVNQLHPWYPGSVWAAG